MPRRCARPAGKLLALPELDGTEVSHAVRDRSSRVPVPVRTATDADEDDSRVFGSCGATLSEGFARFASRVCVAAHVKGTVIGPRTRR